MIVDGRRFEPGTILEADIAIVGAGAAGLTLALVLARKMPRLNILLVEGGGRRFDFKEQSRYFAGADETHLHHPPLELYRRRMLGGTTSIWGGRCIPMSKDDFIQRPDLGRAGWPIAYEEVAQFYPAALDMLEAGAYEFEAADAFPGKPAALGPARSGEGLVLDQIERFSPPTDLARTYARELEASSNIKILVEAACVEVLTDSTGDKVEGLALRAGGKLFKVKARQIVIAAGGLETPRLLLWSRRAKKCGLGNECDQLGRYYMTHYAGELGRIRFAHPPESVHADYAKSRDGVWCRRLMLLDEVTRRNNGLVNFVLRPTIPAIHDPTHGSAVLSAAYFAKRFLIQEYARRLAAMPSGPGAPAAFPWLVHVRNLLAGSPELLTFTSSWTRQRILPRRKIPSLFLPNKSGIYPLEFNAEEIADAGSRVQLGKGTDPNGMPCLSVNWRVAPDFPEQLLKIFDVFGRAASSSGLGDVEVTETEREQVLERCHSQGGHHIGTARMSSTPSDGVVDGDLQVWGTRGLYVLGSAVFPTCGFANPTLTIVALAQRLAERLAETSLNSDRKQLLPIAGSLENVG